MLSLSLVAHSGSVVRVLGGLIVSKQLNQYPDSAAVRMCS